MFLKLLHFVLMSCKYVYLQQDHAVGFVVNLHAVLLSCKAYHYH